MTLMLNRLCDNGDSGVVLTSCVVVDAVDDVVVASVVVVVTISIKQNACIVLRDTSMSLSLF